MSNNNAGGIAPASDITAGWGVTTIIGFGTSATQFQIQTAASGISQ